jgi:hypothetical protein
MGRPVEPTEEEALARLRDVLRSLVTDGSAVEGSAPADPSHPDAFAPFVAEVVDRFRDAAPDVIEDLLLVQGVTCNPRWNATDGDGWEWCPDGGHVLAWGSGGVRIETRPARRLLDYLAGLRT